MNAAMSPGQKFKTVMLHLSGRVQGVGFRHWMAGEAFRLGLRGWVRNTPDGTVEALVYGPAGAVDIMIQNCGDGPRFADVARVEETDVPDPEVPADFQQRY